LGLKDESWAEQIVPAVRIRSALCRSTDLIEYLLPLSYQIPPVI
jgi:hypothetical protein